MWKTASTFAVSFFVPIVASSLLQPTLSPKAIDG